MDQSLPAPDLDSAAPDLPLQRVTAKLAAVRGSFRLLGSLLPGTAARLAEALFVRTSRMVPRPTEARFLAQAEPFRFEADRQMLQGYRWGESGPLVICVHGWGSHAGPFAAIGNAALEAGYRVVAFDGPGHGKSTGWRATMPEFAKALRIVAESEGPVHGVIGHSLGGSATLLALSQGLHAKCAAIIAAPADVTEWLVQFRERMGLSPRVFARLRRNLERRLNVKWDQIAVPAITASLSVPGLVIHDRGDPDVPWSDGVALAESWSGAELMSTNGLGHRQVMRDPGVVERIIAFLGETGQPTKTARG